MNKLAGSEAKAAKYAAHLAEKGDHGSSSETHPLSEKGTRTDTSSSAQESNEQAKQSEQTDTQKEQKKPPGGHDKTPLPHAPPGYTVKFTFHKATNLPMADLNTLSSDPYILAQLNTQLPTRHKEDPLLRVRTPTVRRNVNPEWNVDWVVANIPASGFKLKIRLYDEDPADHDDRLGNVHIAVDGIDENWSGIKNQPYKIRKRAGSKRAYLIRAFATCVKLSEHMYGELHISAEVLGRTDVPDGEAGRPYTLGPCWWTRHYSPMLGRLTGRKEPGEDKGHGHSGSEGSNKKTEHYNFQANQLQLAGPVPAKMYHRYVEFKPFVKGMFTRKGLRGFVLSKALHHQHARVYNYDRSTVWGRFDHPCKEMTKQFLDLVHHDQGGRIFTYVLTLDALLRFTETGKEFGIDMLSKHTMHSDVSIYIAFSGEFFIRRLKHPDRPPPPDTAESSNQATSDQDGGDGNETHPPNDITGGPPDTDPPKDPAHYELVIDNDSGTYRPNENLLPILKKFLAASLPGLHILTLDCQADAEKMSRMKQEQRERKEQEGDQVVFTQGSRGSSISSSDEEELDRLEGAEDGDDERPVPGLTSQLKKQAQAHRAGGARHLREYKHGAPTTRQKAEERVRKVEREERRQADGDAPGARTGGAGE
ncbi:hypothetical protein LTR66_010598 [Elasticomyces elasticus]|nr:hypothetical protein LTR66_010598 [Elasticomyces elasticus]